MSLAINPGDPEWDAVLEAAKPWEYESTKKGWRLIFESVFKKKPFMCLDGINEENSAELEFVKCKTSPAPVFFAAAKYVADGSRADTSELERRALDKMRELYKWTGLKAAWVLTAYGPFFRLWGYARAASMLVPVFPKDPTSKKHGKAKNYLKFEDETQNLFLMISFIEDLGPPTVDHVGHAKLGLDPSHLWVDMEEATFVLPEDLHKWGQFGCIKQDGSIECLPSSGWLPAFAKTEDGKSTTLYHLPAEEGVCAWSWTFKFVPGMMKKGYKLFEEHLTTSI